ncbi:transglutaminase-like domain-containing protein [Paraurantiacibacter namhicola]|nr:transglutaminase family protein [Paraurantiacibacter namhicola]
MATNIEVTLAFRLEQPTDILLQFEAADIPEQQILSATCSLDEADHMARVPAQDDIGLRMWLNANCRYDVHYAASVAVERLLPDIASLARLDSHDLPGEAVQYLFDSRYIPADRFQNFVTEEFGSSTGGAQVLAMSDWIGSHLSYVPGVSNANTTGMDTFVERQGVCRDYAHVMIMLARAAGIPARYVSLYDPGVTPQDFHAVAEVFLADPGVKDGGAWHLVDPTGMADPAHSVKIGVGRDAADVSFLTSFGNCEMLEQSVSVTRSEDE